MLAAVPAWLETAYEIGGVLAGFGILGTVATVGWKVLRSLRHLHEAMFGYKEGETKTPGIVEIVRGNGHGHLLEICERAKQQAIENGALLQSHIETCNTTMDAMQESIQHLGSPAQAVVGVAAVAAAAAPAKAASKAVPAKATAKKVPAKKAAAKKANGAQVRASA